LPKVDLDTKKIKSLSEQLRWQLIYSGIALFIASLLILIFFTIRAVNYTSDSLMHLEASALIHELIQDKNTPLPQGKSLQAYRSWEAIPAPLRRHFDKALISNNEIIESFIKTDQNTDAYLYLLRKHDPNIGDIYILCLYDAELADGVALNIIENMIGQAFLVTLIISIFLFAFIFWLLKKTSRPMSLLSDWARELKENEPTKTVIFPIAELNTLAGQLKDGVNRIAQYNLREQQFLKHASHELRTPLATVQACLDTLNLQSDGAQRKTIGRALKASANMSRLSTTLLWLARESERPIAKEEIELDSFCQQIINDYQYLTQDRDLKVHYQSHVSTIDIELDLFSIILTNLVRNACQYSAKGEIDLQVFAEHLQISNPVDGGLASGSAFPSFGLGLQLIERICRKLDWQFNYEQSDTRVSVSIHWLKNNS